MDKREKIVFIASLPPIQSAIMVDGTGDSMTIKLQIPLSKCPQALRMNLMTQKILRVTVTVQEEKPEKDKPEPKPVDKAKEARHWTPRKAKSQPPKN